MQRNDWKTILVVEDEEIVRQFALTVLRQAGYRTLEAFNGQTGLASFVRHRSEVDLILTDVVMPHSGSEMAEAILHVEPSMKIVFMSGTAGFASFPDQLKRFPMLQKPFTPESLLRTIRGAFSEQP